MYIVLLVAQVRAPDMSLSGSTYRSLILRRHLSVVLRDERELCCHVCVGSWDVPL